MSYRRFVNLVASDCAKNNYTLRRIDMSRFFLPTNTKDGCGWSLVGQDPPPVEEGCRLPESTMDFYPPERHDSYGHGAMDFMLLNNKVVATNERCHALMYDPDIPAIHYLPDIKHKYFPISVAVGNNDLYVLDRTPFRGNGSQSFEALVFDPQEHGWEWRTLPSMPPPPPFVRKDKETWINSLATVRSDSNHTHIWVSVKDDDANGCTYSFDTERLMWSKKPVDWLLPFCGVAEYVPLHNLWFGISSSDHGKVFCASKLTAAAGEGEGEQGSFSLEAACRHPPVLHEVFDDDMVGSPDEKWRLGTSRAVHLGSGKFCIVRFFERYTPNVQPLLFLDYCVVFAGVEVLSCNGKLQMVKHRSERYMLRDEDFHIVL